MEKKIDLPGQLIRIQVDRRALVFSAIGLFVPPAFASVRKLQDGSITLDLADEFEALSSQEIATKYSGANIPFAAFGDTARSATDRKSTRLNSSHIQKSRMPSSA